MDNRNIIKALGFIPKENAKGVFFKEYPLCKDYTIEIDFEKECILYGDKIMSDNKSTQNFSQSENFVVLECVNRLLEKGYQPQNIILEKTWSAGHGTSGRLDICVTHNDGSEYMLIECKTHGKEFTKELNKLHKDGGQLFTYFKFSNKADLLVLYTSHLKGDSIECKYEVVKIEDEYRTGDVKDFYEKWNKLTKDNGVFDYWVEPYNFKSKSLTKGQLKAITQADSSFIFNRFLEILRHNVVSDKGNAFNKIFTLFLCKVYDETTTKEGEELKFQWKEGIDNDIDFQIRLTELYKDGMLKFLERTVSDFDEEDFKKRSANVPEDVQKYLLKEVQKLRLEKNNEFAIKEVYDNDSFIENAKVVREVVELLQKYRIRYNKRQQYLSDFFELLLTTGLKQEAGQFFTPVPLAQFLIKSLPLDGIVDEKLAHKDGEILPYMIDYAAGSGHFLTEYMHEIQSIINKKDPSSYIDETKRKIKNWHENHFDWATQYVYGIEKDYRLVKVGKVGCYLHGDGLANVILSDGLGNFADTKDYKGKLRKKEDDGVKDNPQFDVLLSNPPYSISSFKQTTRNYYTEKDFELYNDLTDNSSEIEVLFIERTKQLLKDGGLSGIILPSSILSNGGIYSKAREMILKHFEVVALAEFGSNTFMATGTNTVVLFLRRRNNHEHINIHKSVENFFTSQNDVAVNGIENPFSKYVAHVWEDLSFTDYLTLISKNPNGKVLANELFKEYRNKLKVKNETIFWDTLLECELEKIFYFILAYPQQVVLVKSGEKQVEKSFLGYEFSNRRGSEGIHPIQRGKPIDQCTKMFDAEVYDNPLKASTYVYNAFKGDYKSPIAEEMKEHVSRANLVDLFTFDRVDFDKSINLNAKKKIIIDSKYPQTKLEIIFESIKNGKSVKQIDTKGRFRVSRIESIANAVFDINATKWTTEEVAEEFFLNKGDILLSHINSITHLGKTAYFDLDDEKIVHGINLLRLIPNKTIIIPKYASIALKTGDFIEEIQKYAIKAANQASLNVTNIKALKIPLPPKDIQQKIVEEIEKLETKEGEVKEKIEKYQNKVFALLDQSKSIKIKIADILTLEYGKSLPENTRIKGEYPVMGSNGIAGWHNDFLIEGPSIIIGRKGSAGKITWIDKNSYPIDTTYYVNLLQKEYNLKILYYTLITQNLESLSGGVGVPGLNRNNVYALQITLPPISEQEKIVAELENIEKQIKSLETELTTIPQQKEAILKKYL